MLCLRLQSHDAAVVDTLLCVDDTLGETGFNMQMHLLMGEHVSQ
jgi:hypothetical protein